MTQEEMLSQMEMMLQPLQQVNASQAETIKKLTEQNESLQSRIKELTAQVAWLNRQLFGRKSEKLPIIDPNYPDLFAGMLPENAQQIADAHDEAVEKITKTREERRQEKNRIMMEDLPVLEQVILTPDNLDTDLYKKIGQEVTRIVEHKPGQLYIKEIIREKWGLKDNTATAPKGMSGVLIAPMPLLPIYKGIAGASLLAEILLQKYEYHMPYYRQIKQYSHLGMKGLTESTVDGWFKQTMELLRPLYEVLKAEVMKSDYVQADETTTPVIRSSSAGLLPEGRKNKDTHKAAQNMAVVCSLLATCRNHDVNPRDYLNDIISQMPYHTKASYEELLQLLPHKWKLTHPESVMTKTT